MRVAMLLLLVLAVMATAVDVALTRHDSRRMFAELQKLRQARLALDREWGQLLLEQATEGTHGRVEKIAREQLGMQPARPLASGDSGQ
ncbi:MAG: cell division protein FtsL [Gammaproteobacteria bacterium]|nr:cell division protein FtsL [Gammaproteobacteria bacterium]